MNEFLRDMDGYTQQDDPQIQSSNYPESPLEDASGWQGLYSMEDDYDQQDDPQIQSSNYPESPLEDASRWQYLDNYNPGSQDLIPPEITVFSRPLYEKEAEGYKSPERDVMEESELFKSKRENDKAAKGAKSDAVKRGHSTRTFLASLPEDEKEARRKNDKKERNKRENDNRIKVRLSNLSEKDREAALKRSATAKKSYSTRIFWLLFQSRRGRLRERGIGKNGRRGITIIKELGGGLVNLPEKDRASAKRMHKNETKGNIDPLKKHKYLFLDKIS